MAVILQMTYSKKLGLPNFSSHQCSVSLQAEIADVSQVTAESKRLYALMQDAVDKEMQCVGYLPDATTYGMHVPDDGTSTRSRVDAPVEGAKWKCSDKQRLFLEKIVRENDLDKREVEGLSREMFGTGVRQLNRLQASGLIDELLELAADLPIQGTIVRVRTRNWLVQAVSPAPHGTTVSLACADDDAQGEELDVAALIPPATVFFVRLFLASQT